MLCRFVTSLERRCERRSCPSVARRGRGRGRGRPTVVGAARTSHVSIEAGASTAIRGATKRSMPWTARAAAGHSHGAERVRAAAAVGATIARARQIGAIAGRRRRRSVGAGTHAGGRGQGDLRRRRYGGSREGGESEGREGGGRDERSWKLHESVSRKRLRRSGADLTFGDPRVQRAAFSYRNVPGSGEL